MVGYNIKQPNKELKGSNGNNKVQAYFEGSCFLTLTLRRGKGVLVHFMLPTVDGYFNYCSFKASIVLLHICHAHLALSLT